MNRIMAVVFAVGATVVAASAANPVPIIQQPLGPSAVHPGSAGFTLKVKGDGFITSTVVNWNGSPLPTTFVSGQEVTAAVPAANVAAAGPAAITVVNPAPKGGTSNTIYLPIVQPQVSNAMTPSATSPTDFGASWIVTGDFNHDGTLDVITGTGAPNTISVLIGNGDGTFQAPVNYAGIFDQSVAAVATGDFNGDGTLDLAIVSDYLQSTGYVYIMLGNPDGTFQSPGPEIALGNAPAGVVAADFNADGNLDLAVSSPFSGLISILLGNGDGTFGPRNDFAVDILPTQMVCGDLNNDGIIDIAAIGSYYDIATLICKGDGTFTAPRYLPSSGKPSAIAAGDINGDGRLDLVVGNYGSGTVSVFLGSAEGLQPRVDYNAGNLTLGVVLGDFNGDGKLDVAATTAPGLSMLLGNGDGTLQSPLSTLVLTSSPQSPLVAGDFNQDGRLDVVFPVYLGWVTTMLQTILTATPNVLTYQFQTVGTDSPPETVVVKNIKGGTVSLGTISIGGADPSDFAISSNDCPVSLAAAESCHVELKFTPTLAGTLTANLLIPSLQGVTQNISITGYATAVSLSPPKLNFGSVTVGQTSLPLLSTVTNVGTVTVNVFKISIGGPNQKDFSQTNTCGATLAPGASCSVNVTFTPSATGLGTASVAIDDDAEGGRQSIALSGTGG